jgi:UDP-2,3-diacylglucosamine hydrolase
MQFLIDGKKFLIGHGDGLGPGDYAYKFLKKIFESKFSRFLFGRLLHANLGQFLGTSWASHSWRSHEKEGNVDSFESPAKEILFQYCKEVEAKEHHDLYINLGDWIRFDSYGVFDDKACTLEKFNE